MKHLIFNILSALPLTVLLLLSSLPVQAAGDPGMAWDCRTNAAGTWECFGVPKPVEEQAPQAVESIPEPLIAPGPPPQLAEPEPEPEPAPAAPPQVAEPEPEPEPAAAPQVAEPEPEPEPVPAPQVAEPEPQPEPVPAPQVAEPEPEPEPVPAPQVAEPEPQPEPAPAPPPPQVAEPEPQPEPAPAAQVAEPEPAAAPAPDTLTRAIAPTKDWELCSDTRPTRPPRPTIARTLSPTQLTADRVEITREGASSFSGNVVVTRADQRLEADDITYEKPANTISARGNVRYSDSSLAVSGSTGTMNLDTDQGSFTDAEYELYDKHARGTAATIRKDKPDILNLEKVTYTTCDRGRTDWYLDTDSIELDDTRSVGTARNVTIRFMDVPIFYTPYLSFPLSDARKSGFLAPSFGSSNESGFALTAPYYWNIAPNRDATITPRIIEKRGLQVQGEYRYLYRSSNGQVNLEALPDDNAYQSDGRYGVHILHTQRLAPRLRALVDYNWVSDRDYFEDLGNSLSSTSVTHLPQRASLIYSGQVWSVIGRVEGYQTIDRTIPGISRPYQRLPQLLATARYTDRRRGLLYGFRGEAVRFERSDSVTGTRIDIKPSISLPWRRPGGYITPMLALQHTRYALDNQLAGSDDSPTRTVPIASVDSGLFLERNVDWFGGLVQTLEPRLYYLYVPFRNQSRLIVDESNRSVVFDTGEYDFNFAQLFRDNRFSGADRIGDANQATLALTSRLIEPASGEERFKLSVGQIFYFRDREVTLPGRPDRNGSVSDFVAEVVARLSRNWSFNAGYQWDNDNNEADRGIAQIRYHPDNRHIVNLAYRYRRDVLEQTDLSARWPINRNLHLVGRWNYSLRANRTLEGFAGFEYDTCCWALRLVGRHWLNDIGGDENNAIYLQLELKGLTSFGNKIESFLEDGILGYRTN